MTDGKRALGQLVGISLMIGFMVVGCGQGTQTASNTGEDITANTETEISETTTLADAQHFYRRLGYKDVGGFIVNVPGYEQPMEMIMIKAVCLS